MTTPSKLTVPEYVAQARARLREHGPPALRRAEVERLCAVVEAYRVKLEELSACKAACGPAHDVPQFLAQPIDAFVTEEDTHGT